MSVAVPLFGCGVDNEHLDDKTQHILTAIVAALGQVGVFIAASRKTITIYRKEYLEELEELARIMFQVNIC